jgi:hypothetical protein
MRAAPVGAVSVMVGTLPDAMAKLPLSGVGGDCQCRNGPALRPGPPNGEGILGYAAVAVGVNWVGVMTECAPSCLNSASAFALPLATVISHAALKNKYSLLSAMAGAAHVSVVFCGVPTEDAAKFEKSRAAAICLAPVPVGLAPAHTLTRRCPVPLIAFETETKAKASDQLPDGNVPVSGF